MKYIIKCDTGDYMQDYNSLAEAIGDVTIGVRALCKALISIGTKKTISRILCDKDGIQLYEIRSTFGGIVRVIKK